MNDSTARRLTQGTVALRCPCPERVSTINTFPVRDMLRSEYKFSARRSQAFLAAPPILHPLSYVDAQRTHTKDSRLSLQPSQLKHSSWPIPPKEHPCQSSRL